MHYEILLLPFLAFLVTAAVLHLLLMRAHHLLPVDRPNERSLHTRPVPRVGGVTMLAGAAVALGLSADGLPFWLWPVVVLTAMSLLDDFVSLPFLPRLGIQLAVSTVFLLQQSIPPLWMLPAVLGMVWMINLYNFMDGSDGLAGSMALAGFGGYALLALMAGDLEIALVCLVLCASALAFLARNAHPASVFMGDGGSIPLGFLAAAIGVLGVQRNLWAPGFPVLCFLVFITDATVTLVRRVVRRERVWQAHRTHYYQRLVRMGAGHVATANAYGAAMLGCSTSAVLVELAWPSAEPFVLAAWLLLFVCFGRRIDRRWSAFEQASQEGIRG